MSRPSYQTPVGSKVVFTIPSEWFVNISGISRKTYKHAAYIQATINPKRKMSVIYKSDFGTSGPMKSQTSGATTFSLSTSNNDVAFDFSFFYTEDKGVKDSQIIAPTYASSKLDIQMDTKPKNASDDIPDYVTYFIFVEDSADSMQVPGSGQFDDMVIIINAVKLNPNPIPPPPPDNVIKPYNPVLDRPRPSTLENYLRQYDVTFLIDDSGSMADNNKWTECRNALIGISAKTIEMGFDSDGIDLCFLNSNATFKFKDEVQGVQDTGKVEAALNKVSPSGGTPTGERVSQLLSAHLAKLNNAKGTPEYAAIRPMDLIVITDGAPTDQPNFELGSMLVQAANGVKAGPHHPNIMGVQFVQIGNDAGAKEALGKLVLLDTGSMVDTVPYAGPGSISPDKLERILLGGLHPNVRALKGNP